MCVVLVDLYIFPSLKAVDRIFQECAYFVLHGKFHLKRYDYTSRVKEASKTSQ